MHIKRREMHSSLKHSKQPSIWRIWLGSQSSSDWTARFETLLFNLNKQFIIYMYFLQIIDFDDDEFDMSEEDED